MQQDTSNRAQAMRSVQHVSTGGARTVLGDRFPLCSSKKPQSLADTELQGPCGSPSSSRALKDARAPHKKQLLARAGAGNGISAGVRGSAVRGMLTGAVFLKLPSLSLPDTFQRYLFHFKRKNVLSARPRGDKQPGDG